MSVFLRWGVFGILGVAALLYAYNASKHLAESHAARAAATPTAAPPGAETAVAPDVAASPRPEALTPPAPMLAAPERCQLELKVAQRAIEMRKQGEPLDRLLRIQEIAWQEYAPARVRLEQVATQWFNREGDIAPSALQAVVINDCQQHPPAP
jgi:hypothetical protein